MKFICIGINSMKHVATNIGHLLDTKITKAQYTTALISVHGSDLNFTLYKIRVDFDHAHS